MLNETLSRFYLSARTRDGELYRGKTLQTMRNSLKRYLQAPPHNKPFNIVKDSEFQKANSAYETAMTEIKREGKGHIENTPAMSKSDIDKLYTSMHMNTNTPVGLANKVQ